MDARRPPADLAGTATLWDLVGRAADRWPGAVYIDPVEDGLEPLTFHQLRDAVRAVAAELTSSGAGPGDRVVVIMPNCTLSALLFVGVISAGRVLVPVNPASSASEVGHIIERTGAKVVYADGSLARRLGSVAAAITFVEDGIGTVRSYLGADVARADPEFDTDVAEIVFTSGSSGVPKGVVLSHRALLSNSFALGSLYGIADGTRFLTVCPLYHNSGQIFTTLTPLWVGGTTTVIRSELAMLKFWDFVERFAPDWILVVNAFLAVALRDRRPAAGSSLQGVLSGGSKLAADLIDEFEATFSIPVFQVYGLTETTSIATAEAPAFAPRVVGSTGRPLAICAVRIVRDGVECAPGEQGEIQIAGDNLFTEYLGMPDLTAGRLRGGWLHTGDTGWLDASGNLTVVDRIDNMVIVGGENVYPAEIETLAGLLEGAGEVLVTSVPNPVHGNELVLVFENRGGGRPDVAAWRTVLARELSTFKVPKRMLSLQDLGLAEFPRSVSGKVLRGPVTKVVLETMADDPPDRGQVS